MSIDNPADGSLLASSASGSITYNGTASVGEADPIADTTLIYVIDVSGSTGGNAGGCAGDENGDGTADRVLDCEIAAVRALNQEAISAGTVDEVGVVAFASRAVVGDVGPAAGTQVLTGPDTDANLNGTPDVEDVLVSSRSFPSGVDQFTSHSFDGFTNFEAAVQQTCSALSASTNPNNVVLFLSDGTATAGGNAIDDLPCAPSATFQTIAAGAGSSCTFTGGGRGSLSQIAQSTGGQCTEVSDLSTLPDVVPGVIDARLTAVDISVDAGSPSPVTTSAPLPLLGPANVTWSHNLGLADGIHDICVEASGSDGGGAGSVTDCHEITVADISLSPTSATNDLTDETSHTVTATVVAGADGGVAGVTVNFAVTSGPNAGATGSATTDASGAATFTWTNPNQDANGLGDDTVVASFDDDFGNTENAGASKRWADLTAPEPDCTVSHNPAGQRPPGAQPQNTTNAHGYFEISADDVIDDDPDVYVRDTGSGTVFGPFDSPTSINWTQDEDATPTQKQQGGANSQVDWHIIGNGDAEVFGVDASGNESDGVLCTVPDQP